MIELFQIRDFLIFLLNKIYSEYFNINNFKNLKLNIMLKTYLIGLNKNSTSPKLLYCMGIRDTINILLLRSKKKYL